MTKKNYYKYIVPEAVFMILVFTVLIFFLIRYQRSEAQNKLTNIGHVVAYTIQKQVALTEDILVSLAYNYEIDGQIEQEKFDLLASKYMEDIPDILYIQHKDKDTVTDMVYPYEYNYTLGSSLKSRSEVEEAVQLAIESKKATANDPFILPAMDIMGLIVRYPLFKEDVFEGFFVVVFDLDSYMNTIIEEIVPSGYSVQFYDKTGKIFWGNLKEAKGTSYHTDILGINNFWTMNISKSNSISASDFLIAGVCISFFSLFSILLYMQIGFLKKNQNIEYLDNFKSELERLQESYTLALDSANDALWEWNLTTGEIITSDKWLHITGNEFSGTGLEAIIQKEAIHKEDYEKVYEVFQKCLTGAVSEFYSEYRIQRADNTYTWVQNKGKVYFDSYGVPDKLAGAVSNIEGRKEKESSIEYLAFYDSLTGLPNKTKFLKTLETMIHKKKERGERYGILMIDLDNFKTHNDLLGLEFCDYLLKQVGNKLSHIAGKENMVARFGGDEFLILVKNRDCTTELEIICQKILSVFKEPFLLMQKSVYVTASIGVVNCFEETYKAGEIIRNADTALNKAKEAGKNQYCFYDFRMHEEIVRKSKVEDCIRKALEEDSIILHYQPQKDLFHNRTKGIEALARLYSKELGMISPIEFITVAEGTGLIIPLGSWVLKHACIQGKHWIDKGYNVGKLAVNISAHQLHDESFYDRVKEILKETKFPPHQLELEITESVLLESSVDNIEMLKKLKSLGITIALDDFGTGYSSLNYLTVLPIDILKIDKSFIDKILEGETEGRLIRSIIELAHNLDLKVVSEGVESKEQENLLKEMECDYIQGYYFSKPEDAKIIEENFLL